MSTEANPNPEAKKYEPILPPDEPPAPASDVESYYFAAQVFRTETARQEQESGGLLPNVQLVNHCVPGGKDQPGGGSISRIMQNLDTLVADASNKPLLPRSFEARKFANELPEGAESQAKLVLERLQKSAYIQDREAARELQQMIDTGSAPYRDCAMRVLLTVDDMDQRQRILAALNNDKTRAGAEKILDWLSAPPERAREQERGEKALVLATTGRGNDTRTADAFMQLLGQDSDAARTVLLRLDGEQRAKALDLLMSSEPVEKKAGKQLLAWLEGDQVQRHAARAYLDLLAQEPEAAASKALLNLIADGDKAQEALSVLGRLEDSAQIKKVMGLPPEERQPIVDMLKSPDANKRQMAVRLAEMLAGPAAESTTATDGFVPSSKPADPNGPADGKRLLSMLGDPERKQDGLEILAHLTNPRERHRALDLFFQDKELARQLLGMVAEKRGALARHLLNDELSAAECKTVLAVPDLDKAVSQLGGSDQAAKMRTLLNMLKSPDEADRQTGTKLVRMLSDSDSIDTAVAVLRANAGGENTRTILSLLSDRTNPGAGSRLLAALQPDNLARAGTLAALEMSRSPDAATKEAGDHLIKMLTGQVKSDSELASVLLSSTAAEFDLRAMSQLLRSDDPSLRDGARQLVSMLKSGLGEGGDATRVLRVMRMLSSASAADNQAGKQLLAMLADDGQRVLASNVIRTSRSPEQIKEFLRLTRAGHTHGAEDGTDSRTSEEKELGKQLLNLASDKKLSRQDAAATLTALLTSPDAAGRAAGEALKKMLVNPDQQVRKDALVMLETVPNPAACSSLVRTVRTNERAGQVLLGMLRSGQPEQTASVTALLDALNAPSFPGPGGRREESPLAIAARSVIDRLGDAKGGELAAKALTLAQSAENIAMIDNMLQDETFHAAIGRLTSMIASDPAGNQAQTARKIIELLGSAREVNQLLQLLDDPKTAATGELLLGMLAGDNTLESFAARRALSMRASQDKDKTRAADEILGMFGDSQKREIAIGLLGGLSEGEIVTFLGMLKSIGHTDDKVKSEVARELLEWLQSTDAAERQALFSLIRLYESYDADEQAQAKQFLSMLSDRNYASTARRRLQNVRFPSEGDAIR